MSFRFVSDLHITGPHDPAYKILLALIKDETEPGDVVVLGGDIFDVFIGKEGFKEKYTLFFQVLKEAGQRGVQLHYIEGNHELMVRDFLEESLPIQVHQNQFELQIGEKRFFVSHGDRVDHKDIGYRLLRMGLKNPFTHLIVSLVPWAWLELMGRFASESSRNKKPKLARDLPPDRFDQLRKVYRNYAAQKLSEGYDFVVMGHCHDLDEMMFRIGNRKGHYANCGFPKVHGYYLLWSPGDDRVSRERLPNLLNSM